MILATDKSMSPRNFHKSDMKEMKKIPNHSLKLLLRHSPSLIEHEESNNGIAQSKIAN